MWFPHIAIDFVLVLDMVYLYLYFIQSSKQIYNKISKKGAFKLPPWRKWGMCSSGTWRSVEWYFVTHVSGQNIGPIFKGQAVQEE